ncbi:hypothetical protein FI667_g2077, partial [Globisporangium splendens]
MAERDRILTQAYSLTHTNMEEQEGFDSVYQSLAKQVLEQDPMDLTDDFVRGNMKLEDEIQLKNNLEKLDMNLMEDKQSIESINDRLQEFDTTFTSLQQQMEVDGFHNLMGAYTKKEEENFALFRYVQSINNEIEQLEDEKHALEKETQKLSSDMKDGNAHARKRMIDDLVEVRQKLSTTNHSVVIRARILKENSEYERLRVASVREFQPIARAVDRLYNALGCNDVMPPGVGGGNNGDASKRSRKQSDDQIAMMARINSMNDLLAAHGITEGNILQFLAIIEQRSSELIEQFSRRLQHKNPMESSRASLGANLHPSDPTRSILAARTILPDSSGNISVSYPTANNGLPENAGSQAAPASSPNTHTSSTSIGNSAMLMDSLLVTSGANLGASIVEEDPMPNISDGEESDRPMTKAELQKRAAKTVAGLQLNPKPQSVRVKAVATKKKK